MWVVVAGLALVVASLLLLGANAVLGPLRLSGLEAMHVAITGVLLGVPATAVGLRRVARITADRGPE